MSKLKQFLINKQQQYQFYGGATMWRKLAFGGATLIGIYMLKAWINKKDHKKPEPVEALRRRTSALSWNKGNPVPDRYDC